MNKNKPYSWKFSQRQPTGWFLNPFRRWEGTYPRALVIATRLARLTKTVVQITADELSPSGVILATPTLLIGYACPDGTFDWLDLAGKYGSKEGRIS